MNKPSHRLLIGAISPAAALPLYEQIIRAIKREIGAGRLRPHAPLPSFRALAEELLVSVITVKRAYEELERDGIIYRRQGLGTFVAEHGTERCRETKSGAAEALLRQAVREAAEAGLSKTEFAHLIKRTIDEEWSDRT